MSNKLITIYSILKRFLKRYYGGIVIKSGKALIVKLVGSGYIINIYF